jgi:hypothetical protein
MRNLVAAIMAVFLITPVSENHQIIVSLELFIVLESRREAEPTEPEAVEMPAPPPDPKQKD